VATTYLNDLGIDEHLRQTNNVTGVSYYLTDHLGTTAALTDTTGNILEQLAYDSFGNSAGSARTRYGYTGRERDPDTGLMYYRARWNDPQLGRFISEDPIGFQGGDINLYAYVVNNPANFRDPTGLQRADRDRPGDIEWARGLKKAIDRMPTPQGNCGCQSKPGNPLLLAGAVAVLDGPQPGPTDIIAVGLLLAYAFGTTQPITTCPPDNVIPFPPRPKPFPLPPPPPPPRRKYGDELCRLRQQVGMFCEYECKDGSRFVEPTDTGTKHGKCPPLAPRPAGL
jgi:RHS repeat-associated protein